MESHMKKYNCDKCNDTGKYLQGSVTGFNDETEQEEEEFWWEPCDCMYNTAFNMKVTASTKRAKIAPTSKEDNIYTDDTVVPKINNIDKDVNTEKFNKVAKKIVSGNFGKKKINTTYRKGIFYDEKGEIISRIVEDKKPPINKTHKGNNKRILKYIDSRMDEGIKKFRQEMPLEFYTVNDILEEVVDACIYASSLLIKIDGAYKRILKEENK